MFGNFSLFKTPFPGWSSVFTSFFSLFVFYIFSYLLSKIMGCFSGCLVSSAGIQKLFCGIYSAFKCSFDEFVGEKVFSPSYASAILAPPPVRNRFKGLDLIDRVPDELWMEGHDIVQETWIKTIPMEKKCRKTKWLSGRPYK